YILSRDDRTWCGGFGSYMASSINFNQFLEKEKLKSNGSNFTDWFRHVRIFLNGGNLQYVLDAPLGDPPAETETDEVKAVYETRKTRYSQVQCAILCSLEADLQKRFEHHDPHELINELKTIFETHAAVECYEASKHFFSCMMEEGSSVSEHMLAMTGHAKKLSDLGIVIPNRLGINRVLQSLPPSYKNFVMNYNMQNMNKELPELFAMLKSAEIEIKKEHQVLMVNKTTSFKKQGKSKGKNKKSGKKAATPPVKPKTGPKPDAECYYCKEKGHWKRNCSKYLADLKSGLVKKKKEGISDIHVIDVYLTGSRTSTWVFDTGSVAHICNSKQELKNKRRLLKDEVTMRVGNGSKVDVIAVGTLPLHLPSGLVLSLNNCYFVPALSMNIISGSCLMQDGYSFKSENNGCSIFMNNIFYGRAPEKNGLFLLDLDSSDTHIHNIDAKRIKLNDNSTYMWHCRLGHIGVKRMKKLHTDGLLESLDFESLDRCEACLMGKMTKTPFSGIMERATDLLEIIHTDVCGPMSVASRGGYRYVLTFTYDLSRYGYIYFMKHKSETFEKFKEFQSEVENQRNKKIKFLRSDRGGEYLSYEFGMHLKKCGILSQLTPPGTPQRNGVSERRNRTLLDMVRSMMSLTDLPLSFWSYALETAAFTLNRAPSKSVETTPYELWFNKKPKLSFLKVWGCEAYVKKLQPDKLEPKAEKCVFIGYPKETIGYTFYHRSEGKIFVAKNGTFLEKEFLTKEVTGRKVELDEIEESLLVDQSSAVPEDVPVPPAPATEEANDNDHETSNEIATEPRRSTRERATPDWYDPCLNVMIVDNNDEDPATYEEAMMSPDSNKWQEAMKSEMGSMYDNKKLSEASSNRPGIGHARPCKAGRRSEDQGQPQFWEIPGSTVLPSLLRRWKPQHIGGTVFEHQPPPSTSRWRKASRLRGSAGAQEEMSDSTRSRPHRLFEPLTWHRWKGSHLALDGVDLSTPSEERTGRCVRRSTSWWLVHHESLVNTLERVALRVIQEIMSHQYSPSGPATGTHQRDATQVRPLPLRWRPEVDSPAYVVYKIGGDPSDYQFLHEAPKEIPHGYTCAYVPSCDGQAVSNPGTTADFSGQREEDLSGTDLEQTVAS
ncbi:hypothetical protein QYE76_032721, partial [Lolium multiflorum]